MGASDAGGGGCTTEHMVFFRVYMGIIAEARISNFDTFGGDYIPCKLTQKKSPCCNYQQ